ncbi:MAG: hypothetical protein QOE96_4226 [Blastocatellia bacterium]|jgi:hypothetical protein|nr:hypothetical protein [Blastocatellia bacterium]
MGKHRFTKVEGFAIWKHHGPWCFWCEEPLRLSETTIDHYIPEYLENRPAELDKVRADYGLSASFVINDYCNWLPSHARCNQKKGAKIPKLTLLAVETLDKLGREAETIRSIEQQIRSDVKKDKLIGQVAVALETNKLTRDEVRALLNEPTLQQDEDIELLRMETYLDIDQHYVDFLNRKPNPNSLAFWSNQIAEGQQSSAADNANVLANVSSAFFLSREFYDTGSLVYRMYKAAFGSATGTSTLGATHMLSVPIIRLSEFVPAIQQIGQGVIEGEGDWQTQLESNKAKFMSEFVSRSRFAFAYPTSMTATQFVDQLNTNAGNVLSASARAAAIASFGSATNTSNQPARARALRRVAENADLNSAEFNCAFVLMQYFGYLRRDPNDPPDTDFSGYDFWLRKLNEYNGDYAAAEMVKAFITSDEYRQRFGAS